MMEFTKTTPEERTMFYHWLKENRPKDFDWCVAVCRIHWVSMGSVLEEKAQIIRRMMNGEEGLSLEYSD